jgi:1-acyl-sn-glycerol-3-phosphate acyltransferase
MDIDTVNTVHVHAARKRPQRSALPKVSPWLLRLFTGYARHYMQRSLHSVRLLRTGGPPQGLEAPLVLYCNHPSWWDPLLCLFLAQCFFPERTHYAPIDARALECYRFFARLGFFGVTPGTRRGAATFLRVGTAILQQPQTALWITPEGQFTDARQRPVRLQPGLGHLASRLERGVFVPLALEYPFWKERFPEALGCFGEVVVVDPGQEHSADAWTALLAQRLEATQERLAEAACRRDPEAFDVLLGGRAGVGGVYDVWRRLRAWRRGEQFHQAHGREDG